MPSTSRRNFLAAPLAARGWAGANDRVRVAIIGMGGRGGDHLKIALDVPNVEIATLCDPDDTRMAKWGAELESRSGKKPRLEPDLRRVLEDRDIDAITVATCNHWHALATVWACQAGKHVYVEKPVCHNLFEGRQMVAAARKYRRVVQGGTQTRSSIHAQHAMRLLRDGIIGDLYMARSIHYEVRNSIGFQQPEPPPAWLHWDLWLGPAPQQPYHRNLVHYNWHWFWDFGSGELGNNGVHTIDVARWGINKGLPMRIHSCGGRFGYKDQGQTPNTQVNTFEYDDGTQLVCEIRGRFTNDEVGSRHATMFYGSKGYMTMADGRPRVYLGNNKTPEQLPGEDSGARDNMQLAHFRNFFEAIRAGKPEQLAAEINETYQSSAICLLGNISYRLGRKLHFDPATERFRGDEEADRYLTRPYRAPYVVPKI